MTRRTTAALALLIAAVAPAADPDPRSPKDPFGRPRPHGEPFQGAFVGLSAGRTNLFFGQPFEIELFGVPATDNGPYVHPRLEEPANAPLEVTDGEGRPVPYRPEFFGVSSGGGLTTQRVCLWPTPAHAVGVYWKPGTYRLRATVVQTGNAATPSVLPGKFQANDLTLTVAEPGAILDRREPDAPNRDRIVKWIAALEAEAAGDPAAVEKAQASAARLRAALKAHDQPLRDAARGGIYSGERTDFWLWAAGLDEAVSERMRLRAGATEVHWRMQTARFAPINVPQGRPLTQAETTKLLADLRHDDPWVRMRAVRSVPKGAPADVRTELVERLRDPYREWSRGGGEPAEVPMIRFAARDAAGRLGGEMIEPLLAFAARGENKEYRRTVANSLARIGPDPKAREFLRGLIRGGRTEDHYGVLEVATAWGRDGVELLRELTTTPGVHGPIFRDAIEGLGRFGDPAVDGPTAHRVLTDPVAAARDSGVQSAAAQAVRRLGYKKALPELDRIARDPGIDQNTRYPAVDGVLAMSDEKAGTQLLMDLTDPRIGGRVRAFAFTRLGQRKVMAALPTLLDALADDDWYTRVMADGALRGLSERWEGVGYDPRSPAPARWRDYWAPKSK
jgi:HEAT repeat protein